MGTSLRSKVPVALIALSMALRVSGSAVATGASIEDVDASSEHSGASSSSDPDGAGDPDGGREKPRLHLRAGDVILGSPGVVDLQVRTRYGVLTVPAAELVQVRFAPRVPAEERRRIEDAIRDLADGEFDRREDAMATLRSLGGSARRFLREALRSPNEEVRSRAQALLAESPKGPGESAGGAAGLEPLRNTDDDEVVTRRFTIRGEILQEVFTVKSSYGDLVVGRDDLVGIVLDPGARITRKIEVSGAMTVPESWLDTKFDVPAGSRVSLKAKGQLFLSSYNLVSGPEGSARYSGSTFGTFPRLGLVGKIGRNGKPFLVGKQAEMKVPREGRLYLGVVSFNRSHVASGSYQVQFQASPE